MNREEPLKRTELPRATPAQVRAWQAKPRKPLPKGKRPNPESAKHRAQRPTRAKVVAFVRARDRTCQAVEKLDHECGRRLDVHEIVPRSAWALGYLEPDNCVLVCSVAHAWIDDHPDEARTLGLHGYASDRGRTQSDR